MEFLSRFRKFGILTLLIAVTWIAVSFAGYQAGFHRGMDAGIEERHQQELITVPYHVAPLVISTIPLDETPVDFKPLIALIKDNIDPSSWSDGKCSITEYPTNLSLIISQYRRNHDEIAQLMNVLDGQRELHQSRIAEGLCVQCGSDEFDRLERENSNPKIYDIKCGNCGYPTGGMTFKPPDN